jgi:hypothetical protein
MGNTERSDHTAALEQTGDNIGDEGVAVGILAAQFRSKVSMAHTASHPVSNYAAATFSFWCLSS